MIKSWASDEDKYLSETILELGTMNQDFIKIEGNINHVVCLLKVRFQPSEKTRDERKRKLRRSKEQGKKRRNRQKNSAVKSAYRLIKDSNGEETADTTFQSG